MALPHEVQPRKRRRGLKITGCILLALTAAAVGIGFWQRNNIEAVRQYTQYTQEELEQQLESNDAQVQEVLQAALEAAKQVDAEAEAPEPEASDAEPEAEVPPSSEAEKEETGTAAPSEGEKPADPPAEPPKTNGIPQAQEPAEDKVTTPAVQPQTKPTPAPAPTVTKPAAPSGPTYEQQLKVIVDKVYALRSQYLQALDDLQAEAVSAYKAIPKTQRTKKALATFVNTYISKATNLEKQCDGQMDGLVGELTRLQKKYGQSLDLVDTVKYTYANEKSLKKAWYMSELEKRGLI